MLQPETDLYSVEFLEYLRLQGFIIGVDHHLRIQILLEMLGSDCSAFDLKTVLCPVFAINRKQQQKFYHAFDLYFKHVRPLYYSAPNVFSEPVSQNQEHSSETEPITEHIALDRISESFSQKQEQITKSKPITTTLSSETTKKIGTKKWLYFIICLFLLILAVFVGYWKITIPKEELADETSVKKLPLPLNTKKIISSESKSEHTVTDEPVNLPLKEMSQSESSEKVNPPVEKTSIPVKDIKEAVTSENKAETNNPSGSTDLRDVKKIKSASISHISNTGPQFTDETIKSDTALSRQNWNIRQLMLPLIFFYLLLEGYLFYRRKLALMRQRGKEPPFFWPIHIDLSEIASIKNEQFYSAVNFMRQRLKSEIVQLDVEKTIKATIELAGFPEFHYKPTTRIPEYLVLIDMPAKQDHHPYFFSKIMKLLENEGVFVISYFYENNPRVCFTEIHGERILLSSLQAKFKDCRLIIIGDGEDLLDPISGELDKWTHIFDTWSERAILTPEAPENWSVKESTLAQEFIVLPATFTGLSALAEYFNIPSKFDTKKWNKIDLPASFPTDIAENISNLRAYLGEDTFQWLCACAIYPELQWDMTLYLGTLPCMPDDLINEENLLRLIHLPCFRKGVMPDTLRWELITNIDDEKIHIIRKAIITLIEKSPPPKGTYAYDTYRLNLKLQQWMLSPENRRQQQDVFNILETIGKIRPTIQDYTLLHFLESTSKSPLSILLPRRFHKLIYRRGIPAFGLRTSVRILISVLASISVFLSVQEPILSILIACFLIFMSLYSAFIRQDYAKEDSSDSETIATELLEKDETHERKKVKIKPDRTSSIKRIWNTLKESFSRNTPTIEFRTLKVVNYFYSYTKYTSVKFFFAFIVFGITIYHIKDLWIRISVLAAILTAWISSVFLKKIFKRRIEDRFVRQIINQDTAYIKDFGDKAKKSAQEVQKRWKEAIYVLKKSHLKREGNPLYVLPWYMIIGESGSGKTTAIESAGLPGIFSEIIRTSGISGTRNCDWWFFEKAIIIDTAGRYAIPVDEGRDKEEWRNFLSHLVKYRKKEPLNGLIVTVRADKLVESGTDGLAKDGKDIRMRIQELMQGIGSKFPIYVLVTKCDLVKGMTQFCDLFPEKSIKQAMGFINSDLTTDVGTFLKNAMLSIGERLRYQRLLLFQKAGSGRIDPSLLLFPEEFEKLEPNLNTFISGAFQETPYQKTPVLRGVYFSSGRQEGSPYSHFLNSLGLIGEREVLPGTSKGLFLFDIFSKILPDDRRLYTPTIEAERVRMFKRKLGFVSWVAFIIALCLLMTFSFGKNLLILNYVNKYGKPPQLTENNLKNVKLISDLNEAILEVEKKNKNWWFPRYGLNKSIEVEERLKAKYCELVDTIFLENIDKMVAGRVNNFDNKTPDKVIGK